MLFLIIGLALGALLGVLFMRNKSGLNPLDFQKEMQLEKEKAGLAATLQEQLKQMELLVNEKEQYKNAVDSKDAELNAVNIRIVKAEEAFRTQREKLEEKKVELEALQSTLTKEFENIANKILDEKSHKFTEQNKNNLDVILSPLKDRIKDFEEKVDRSYKNEAAERNTLKGSIEELMKFTNKISV